MLNQSSHNTLTVSCSAKCTQPAEQLNPATLLRGNSSAVHEQHAMSANMACVVTIMVRHSAGIRQPTHCSYVGRLTCSFAGPVFGGIAQG